MTTLKKVIAALLSAGFLLTASGCVFNEAVDSVKAELFDTINFEDDTNYTSVEPNEALSCEYYEPVDITYGYDHLSTEEQKKCYTDISEAVYRISEEANDKALYPVGKVIIDAESFSEADMHITINAFTEDHPEVFWISNQFSYGSMGNKTTLQLYSYLSGSACTESMEALTETVNDIVASVPSGLNQYHLEKYIHNTVLDMCEYAEGVKDADDGWQEFSAYGALVKGSAVCEGYSYAMNLLLSKVGIYSYYINGRGEDSLHMWNVVNIDGNWYHLDATWNDSTGSYYNFFNLTDGQIEKDHIIASVYTDVEENKISGENADVFNIFVPECTSESANYYTVESTLIVDFEESAPIMVNDLVQAAQNKDTDFTIKFDSSLDFNDSMDAMFNEEPYYMFNYISQANEQLDESSKINAKSVSIIILENFNAVVVKMEYIQD